jgi:CTP synthase
MKASKPKDPKYIFIVGGVISGVGKGVAASSIGKILQARGLEVTAIKIDPYVNIDAGTMNPTEHGEVFVLKDGDETDQDMGNYERFLNIDLTRANYMTTGRVYLSVIEKERSMYYKGACVEVVPHIPLEIIGRISKAQKNANGGKGADVVIVEIGGTIGEYQNMLFLEAARMLKTKHPKDVFFGVVSYLPVPSKIGEMKTKPTQMAVRTLNASGIQPDLIIARGQHRLDEKRKEKIAFMCNLQPERIISAPDVESIYDVPINFEREGLSDLLCEMMGAKCSIGVTKESKDWRTFVKKVHSAKKEVNIAVVGKYFETGEYVLSDSYLSVIEAVKYSAYTLGVKPKLTWINSEKFEKSPASVKELSKFDGVLVPGGFGTRGIEGILKTINYARTKKIPYFGLCYGMQLLTVEFARNVAKLSGAHTVEVDESSEHPVIATMADQIDKIKNGRYGNTMRVGDYPCVIKKGTIAHEAYKELNIVERHRHRYEVNSAYVKRLEDAGLVFSGRSPDGRLMEIAELSKSKHPFFLGTQYHPEFLARPLRPHKLFTSFIKACIKK